MSGPAKDWLFVLIFFIAFFAYTFAEAAWLSRRSGATYARALLLAFSSNTLCITVGFFGSFLVLGVILAMAWDQSLSSVPGGDTTIWYSLAVAVLFPMVLLIFVKRLLVRIIKLEIPGAWWYSALSSFLFLVTVLSLPIALAYLF